MDGFSIVLRNAEPFAVELGEIEQRLDVSVLCGEPEPSRRLPCVSMHAAAVEEHAAEQVPSVVG